MILPLPERFREPDPWRRTPHYQRRVGKLLERAVESGTIRPGTAVVLEVFHDAYCDAMHDKGPCNCCPALGSLREVGKEPFAKLPVVQLVHLPKTA